MSIFEVALESFIDMNHELVILTNPKIVGMMLSKIIYNLSDAGVAVRWQESPYMLCFNSGDKDNGSRLPGRCPIRSGMTERVHPPSIDKHFLYAIPEQHPPQVLTPGPEEGDECV